MLPEGVTAVVNKDSYPIPPIFSLLQSKGSLGEKTMYNTYNMGLGMVLTVDPTDVDKTIDALKAAGETAYVIGKVETGDKGVILR